jgi:glycosyltransferase involved in cell wall biosynthesis
MKVIFINGRQAPPLFQGGDGVSIHTLLAFLSRRGHQVHCIGKVNPHRRAISLSEVREQLHAQGTMITKASEDYVEYTLNDQYHGKMYLFDAFHRELRQELVSFQPDSVLTQLEDSHEVIRRASELNYPVLHFVHDTHPLNMRALQLSNLLACVLFNSHFTATTYNKVLQCPSEVLYPPIDRRQYQTHTRIPRSITFINPVARKGVSLVEALIKAFPEESFLLVPGWEPVELDVSTYPNATLLDRHQPSLMNQVYAQTKLLLAPSQYEETFGRVAAEALVNGIPVIASHVGGLPEAVGPGGWLVGDFTNRFVWVDLLTDVLAQPKELSARGVRGQIYAQQFHAAPILGQFERILQRVCRC